MEKNTAMRLNVIEKPAGQTGCAVIPKRWVVERSIAWAGRNRLASKEYNRNPESSEAFLYLGSIAMLLNRLYPRCSFLITLLNVNPGEGYADFVYASPGGEKRSPYNRLHQGLMVYYFHTN
jgi:hypothetical protein